MAENKIDTEQQERHEQHSQNEQHPTQTNSSEQQQHHRHKDNRHHHHHHHHHHQPQQQDQLSSAEQQPRLETSKTNTEEQQKEMLTKKENISQNNALIPSSSLTCTVLAFGSGKLGQLGVETQVDLWVPSEIVALRNIPIIHAVCARTHSLACTASGEVYVWGDNEFSVLGRRGKSHLPNVIDVLQSQIIEEVGAGYMYSLCRAQQEQVYVWGMNSFINTALKEGGHNLPSTAVVDRPRAIPMLTDKHIVQIASGGSHVLCLAHTGDVYALGRGVEGQLALDIPHSSTASVDSASKTAPKSSIGLVTALTAVPIRLLAAGETHSLALSVSGTVYAWGENTFGQLGLNDVDVCRTPTPIRHLAKKHIVQIACGAFHSLALSQEGLVWSFGHNEMGQLGLSHQRHEKTPQLIESLRGERVVDIAAGKRHSLLVVYRETTQSYAVYTFGSGQSGQLGLGSSVVQSSEPRQVTFEGIAESSFKRVFSGATADHSLVVVDSEPSRVPSAAHNVKRGFALGFTLDMLHELSRSLSTSYTFEVTVDRVFAHAACLNASFLSVTHWYTDDEETGVDLDAVRQAYALLLSLPVSTLLDKALLKLLTQPNSALLTEPEQLRFYLILLEYPPLASIDKRALPLVELLVRSLHHLNPKGKDILLKWWSRQPKPYLERLTSIFKGYLSLILQRKIDHVDPSLDMYLPLMLCNVLKDLYEINKKTGFLPLQMFYLPEVSRVVSLREEYVRWVTQPSVFSFPQFPFLLDPIAKTQLLHISHEYRQQLQVQQTFIESMQLGVLPNPFLVLVVRRDHLIQDTLDQISSKEPSELKKPLRVHFYNEQGVDEGGVRREFFHLLVTQLFDVQYGMFIELEDRSSWFNHASLETGMQYHLVGLVLGLAVYNGAILNVQFPLVVYKKLLGQKLTFDDFKRTFPTVGKGLQQLLDYNGNVQEAFGLTFQISVDVFGAIKVVNLKENGGNIPVTNENRHEFVELYTKYMLEDSIKTQYEEFAKGFLRICACDTFWLFQPEELSLCVSGDNDANLHQQFYELEKGTRYNGFTPQSPVIQWLWEVLHSLSHEEKKKFLKFLTGTDRVPLQGLAALHMTVQRNGPDSDRLPTASTCYTYLLLPEYSSKEKLRNKLLTALSNYQGFGLA